MMMGIGNLTEMTDVDSAALNVLLLGICQELGIGSVLTTEVINWARSSVRECDLALPAGPLRGAFKGASQTRDGSAAAVA